MSVILLSGGLDSFVLLRREVEIGGSPSLCITLDYGQKHSREIHYARNIAEWCRVDWRCHKLPPAAFLGSSLTGGGDVPKGIDYRDPRQSSTVVHGRNMVFLSVAVAEAVRIGTGKVLFAAHGGDSAIYADCRKEFVSSMSEASESAYGVKIQAPFLGMTKQEIVLLGKSLNAPYGLPFDLSWSCYQGESFPCGQCGACIERSEAIGETK
jgi:7-cyano-7-deazaguanine synthase